MPKNLERLFAPQSVAVVGASSSTEKAGYQAVLSLETFEGDVYPVNPKADEILGHKAYPSLSAIGKPVDLVIFAVPAVACVEVAREAIACDCGGGLIMSGGFAEAGEAGAEIQDALATLCAESSFRLLGPNTAGFMNTHVALRATFAAGADEFRRGAVGVIAQSSGVNLLVSFLIGRRGSGISTGIGVGNSLDIDVADALEFLASDPETHAIALHLEGIADGRRLYQTLKRITPKKPVVALIVGREDIGDFAKSHTGNLVGSYELKRNALLQAGAIVVDSIEDLAVSGALLARHRLPAKRAPGIGVLTGQGGAGLIMLDWLKAADVAVPALQDATLSRIRELLPPMTYLNNPVDTARPGSNFPDVLLALASDPQIDAVIAFALPEPTMSPETFLADVQSAAGKPILFGTGGPEAHFAPTIKTLRDRGFDVSESPEQLARAAIVLAHDAIAQSKLAESGPDIAAVNVADLAVPLDEDGAKNLLATIGIATPQRVACASHEQAHAAFKKLQKPLVAKILAQELAHKTEAGGVHLNISDEAGLQRALEALDAIPLDAERRYLIESMAPAGVELILGAVRDASFGPTVTVGMGGTLAEAIRDTATRIAPVSKIEAHAMLAELRTSALLDGWRGSPAVDRDAIAEAIVRLSMVLDQYPALSEIEINPLRAYPDGIIALDALAV